jgi:hypothetical protein
MNVQWYDELQGIEDALRRDLAGFHELILARRDDYVLRGRPLHEWIVARRFWLNGSGNVWVLENTAHEIPFVFAYDVVARAITKLGSASNARIAPHDVTCERCGRAWELRNAHDYRVVHDDDDKPHHFHNECRRFAVADEARAMLTRVVREAGIEQELLTVPNLYGSDSYAGPWLTMITEQLGRVTLGWRKRVIAIEWERGPDGREVFASESVTVDSKLVHAWNPEQATSYLRRLMEASC